MFLIQVDETLSGHSSPVCMIYCVQVIITGYCLETIFQTTLLSEAWTHYGERKGELSQIVLTDDYICGERMILVRAGWLVQAGSGHTNYDDNNNGTDPFRIRHQTVQCKQLPVAATALKSSVSKTSGK